MKRTAAPKRTAPPVAERPGAPKRTATAAEKLLEELPRVKIAPHLCPVEAERCAPRRAAPPSMRQCGREMWPILGVRSTSLARTCAADCTVDRTTEPAESGAQEVP